MVRQQEQYQYVDPFTAASTAATVPPSAWGNISSRANQFLSRAGSAISSRAPQLTRFTPALRATGRIATRVGGPLAAIGMAGLDAYSNRDNPNYDIGGQLAGNAAGFGLGLLAGPAAPIVAPLASWALGRVGSNVNLIPDSDEVKVARANQELSNRLQNISDPVIANELVEQNRNQLRRDLGLSNSAETGFNSNSSSIPDVGDTLTNLPDSVTDFRPMSGEDMLNEMYNPASQTFQGRRMLEQMAMGDARLLNRDQHQMGMQKLGMELQASQAANALQGYLADSDSYRRFLGGFVNRINY